jgi:hypothetical protein
MRVHLCSLAILALCLLGTACSDRPEPDLNPSPGKQIITAETAAREAEVEVLMERQEQRFAALSLCRVFLGGVAVGVGAARSPATSIARGPDPSCTNFALSMYLPPSPHHLSWGPV